MTEPQPIYQVRKVFDPRTLSVREELVLTGYTTPEPVVEKAVPDPVTPVNTAEPISPDEPVVKVKRRRRKKKTDA